MKFSVRLSHEDTQKLEEMAGRRGITASDLVRDMIRAGYDHQAVTETLKEIKVVIDSLGPHKGKNNDSGDIAEIRRIVTLIGMAMPSVAKQL